MNNVKNRLIYLEKTQVKLMDELRNRGISIRNPAEMSQIINGRILGNKADKTLVMCDQILTEWETSVSVNN